MHIWFKLNFSILLHTREPFSFTLIYRRFLAIRTFLLLLSQYFPSPNNHNLISFPLLKFLIYTLLILFKLMNQFSIILILPGVHTIVAPFFLYLPSNALQKLTQTLWRRICAISLRSLLTSIISTHRQMGS